MCLCGVEREREIYNICSSNVFVSFQLRFGLCYVAGRPYVVAA